jgi:biotin operon repressor
MYRWGVDRVSASSLAMKLGVSRQTVLQRVKRGELQAVLVRQGRRKGLRIKVIDQQSPLFEQLS